MGNNLIQVGWREWVALPDLGIATIKAKLDSGARTSCIHAFYVEDFKKGSEDWVRFGVHPKQNDTASELVLL
ncbi:MAG: RimK/LysX family protein [Mariprofundus sp.]|nr:RimK/LysX family protein [Mariprofundus sp.]